jgi:hypothetical protein
MLFQEIEMFLYIDHGQALMDSFYHSQKTIIEAEN